MNTKINESIFDCFPILETDRLILRAFEEADAATLFEIRSDKRVMEHMDTNALGSIEDAKNMIQGMHESFEKKEGLNWAIIEKSSIELVGYFNFWRLDKKHCRAEIGYALHPNAWGNGYLSETMKEMIPFAFKKLTVHSIEANINPNNIPSKRVLERSGFRQEAHFRENYLFNGKFTDSLIFSLLESDL